MAKNHFLDKKKFWQAKKKKELRNILENFDQKK